MNWFVDLIKASHIEVENRPEPYGLFHIAFVVLSLAVIITVCYFARKSSDKVFRIVIGSIGAVLILSEVYKQLYYYFAAGNSGYDWWVFPFQLCSVPMYLSVVVGCMKKCKVRDAICEYLACIGLLGGIMAYIEPSGILNPYYFTLIHSCLWHALLIFIGLYVLFTGNAGKRLKDYRSALIVFGGVVLTATVLNIIFRDKPEFNMCYISPFDDTPLAVFSTFDKVFSDAMGWYPGRILSIILYIFAISLGGFGIYSAAHFIKKKLVRKNKSKEKTSLTV